MPHVCGDEPAWKGVHSVHGGVCPTYVGMNRFTCLSTLKFCVCPTYVGMNRILKLQQEKGVSMPHVCGDEPAEIPDGGYPGHVCPTYVGMNRWNKLYGNDSDGMPHVCGDEPTLRAWSVASVKYAPRMWG